MYTTVSPYSLGTATTGGVVFAGPTGGVGVASSADPMNHITMGIWIGGYKALQVAAPLLEKGIRNVVNTAIEFITETPEMINWEDLHRNGITVHNTYWDDTLAQPIFPTTSLEGAVKKIDEVVQSGGQVLVNCAMGKSRSSSCVIAYLMARQGMGFDQALALIKRSRPQCQPNPNFERQLRQLEASLRSTYPITASHAHNLSALDGSGAASPQGHRYASPNPHGMHAPSSPHGSQLLSVSPNHATITRSVSPTFALANDNHGPMPSSPRYSSFSSPAGVGTAAASAGASGHGHGHRHGHHGSSHHSPFHSLKSYFSHHGSGGASAAAAGGHAGGNASSPVALGHNDVHGMHRAASMSGAGMQGLGYGGLNTNSPHHGYGQSTAPTYTRVNGGGASGQAWRPYGPTSSNQGYNPHTPQPYRVGNGMGGYYDVSGMGRRLSL